MYNDQLKQQLKAKRVTGRKTATKQFTTIGDALIAFYLNGGRESRRIQNVMVTPGYPKLPSGRQLRAVA